MRGTNKIFLCTLANSLILRVLLSWWNRLVWHRVTGTLQCFRLISTHCTTDDDYPVLQSCKWLTRVNLAQESRGSLLVTFGQFLFCPQACANSEHVLWDKWSCYENWPTLSQVRGRLQGLSSHSSFKHRNVKCSHAFFFHKMQFLSSQPRGILASM